MANTWYKQHEAAGGAKLPPSFTNDFIDTVKRTAPQTEEGLVIGGETEVTKLIQRVEALRDKPISLAGAQEIDEALGNLIDKQYGVKGLSKEGNDLLDLQTSFREQLEKAAPAGDVGAVGGIDALTQARKAWSQAMKMGDLERIQLRASQTEQPSTEIRRGIRTLLGNERRSRGYTDEEGGAAASQQARLYGRKYSIRLAAGWSRSPLPQVALAGSASGGRRGRSWGLRCRLAAHLEPQCGDDVAEPPA